MAALQPLNVMLSFLFIISGMLPVHCYRFKCDKIPEKKIDTAFLTINTKDVDFALTIMGVTSECYTCDLHPIAVLVTPTNSCTILVDSRWPMRLALVGDNLDKSCSESKLDQRFLEGGQYSIKVNQHSCGELILMNSPQDSNIPIYVAMGCMVGAALLWYLLKRIYRSNVMYKLMFKFTSSPQTFLDPQVVDLKKEKYEKSGDPREKATPVKANKGLRRRKVDKASDGTSSTLRKSTYTAQDLGLPTNQVGEEEAQRPQKERLRSLDTFRGISIIIMIFVNYRGGDYWFFRHSKWNGLTVADLVFPWFIWIMGTAMSYSFQSLLKRMTPKKLIFWKIFKRSCILFGLGLLINSSDGLNPVRLREFRIPGVLQRFAGTYLIIATMHMLSARPNDPNQYTWYSSIRDVVDYWKEWVFNLLLVLAWLLLTFLLPVPGCPKGYLGPGGWASDGNGVNVTNCTGGAAAYIDKEVFGKGRIYQHPTCNEIYHSDMPHDPEGLLGILTSCFMCFLGLQAGKILTTFSDWKARVRRFLIWGVVLGIIAVILCEGKKDGGFIPINKNLWSLSFVICLSCFAFFLFSFCYVTIDVYKIWSGAPFYYPGMNAILLYMGHEILNQPLRTFWGIQPNSHAAYLGINIADTAVWVFLGYFLHHKKVYVSV